MRGRSTPSETLGLMVVEEPISVQKDQNAACATAKTQRTHSRHNSMLMGLRLPYLQRCISSELSQIHLLHDYYIGLFHYI